MTDIRELLRDATEDLVIDGRDPVGRVRRATSRHRRTRVAIVAVAAAVVAAVVVPVAVMSGSGPQRPAGATKRAISHFASDHGDVAAGFGAIWAVQSGGGSTKPTSVDELNPTTGKQIHLYPVPGPASKVAVGAGRVWVIGATDGGPSSISAIDPASGHVVTLPLGNVKAEPDDIAFAANSAWITFPLLNQVWRVTPHDGPESFATRDLDHTAIPLSHAPTSIATTGNGQLWVERPDYALTRLIPTATGARVAGKREPSGNVVFNAYGLTSLLASDETGAFAVIPSKMTQCGLCDILVGFDAPGQIFDALRTASGVYLVSTRGVYFFSTAAIAKATDGVSPTATLPERQGGSLAPDGSGVVISTGDNGVLRWLPSTQPVPPPPAVEQTWAPNDSVVAVGGGSVWGLECCAAAGTASVDQINPTTGKVIAQVKVPAPVLQIAYGAGHVWVIGFNPGGGSTSVVTTIDPRTLRVEGATLEGGDQEPHNIAFAAGSAWITQPLRNDVLRATVLPAGYQGPGPNPTLRTFHVSGAPETIAATRSGAVWVQRQKVHSAREVTNDGRMELDSGHVRLLGPLGRNGLLQAQPADTVIAGSPIPYTSCASGHHCPHDVQYTVDGRVIAAVATSRGVFIATAHNTYLFAGGRPKPVAVLRGTGGSSLAADGDGVVIGTAVGLVHWIPASS